VGADAQIEKPLKTGSGSRVDLYCDIKIRPYENGYFQQLAWAKCQKRIRVKGEMNENPERGYWDHGIENGGIRR
jgi:hypothetical protein